MPAQLMNKVDLSDGFFSGSVEDVDGIHVKRDGGLFAHTQLRAWVDTGNKRVFSADEIKEDLVSH